MEGIHVVTAADWGVTKWEHFKRFLYNLFKRKNRRNKMEVLSGEEK